MKLSILSTSFVSIGKSLVTIFFTLIGLLLITFLIGRVMPIDPVLSIIGESANQETYDIAYKELGLDKPLIIQFITFIWSVLQLDFGVSLLTAHPVLDDIARVFPATIELASAGTIFGVLIGVPLGVISAVKRGTLIDHFVRVIALIGYSMPVFWIGLIGLIVFYGFLGWVGGPGRLDVYFLDIVPNVTGIILIDSLIAGEIEIFKNAFSHIILPASFLAYYSMAYICRMTRSFMLEQLDQEYITTARVKGLAEKTVIWRHALGNIRVQLLTVIALSYASLLEGSVLTETIFSWPGIGLYITQGLLSADMNAVLGGTIVIGLVFICINMISEVLYKTLDQRAK